MKPYLFILNLLATMMYYSTASATSILPLSLEQLSTRATLIIYGEVISSEAIKDAKSGQIATLTTFNVIDLIKGKTGNTHIIKQVGGKLKNSNVTLRVHGVPTFELTKRYVVFLPSKSKLGFSSPLGLYQGSFSVLTIDGEQVITNGSRLSSVQKNTNVNSISIPLAAQVNQPKQFNLDNFINTVRAFNTP